MMPRRAVTHHVLAGPSRPSRLHTESGRDDEVRGPEVVRVGRTTLAPSAPAVDVPDAGETWIRLSPMLIESIEPMGVSARPADS